MAHFDFLKTWNKTSTSMIAKSNDTRKSNFSYKGASKTKALWRKKNVSFNPSPRYSGWSYTSNHIYQISTHHLHIPF